MFTQDNSIKAALYCRISREDDLGLETSQSIQTQEKKLTAFATHNNMQIVSIYRDDGYSGTTFERPAFKQLIADIESKKVNCVVVKDLSRLGREYIQSGHLLEHFFPQHKTRFISLDDNIDRDPMNPSLESNMMIPFFNLMNEFYPADISKKTRSALYTKAANGQFLGAFAPYGYFKSETNKNQLLLDEYAAPWVHFMFEKTSEGWSYSYLARYLHMRKVKSPTDIRLGTDKCNWVSNSVKSILKNEIYTGKTIFGKSVGMSYKNKTRIPRDKEKWYIVENTHLPIISQDLYDKVQNILDIRSRECCKGTIQIFTGFVYCPDCGCKIDFYREPRKSNPDEGCFVCRTYKRYGKNECTRHYIRYSVLYSAVIDELNRIYLLAVKDRKYLYGKILTMQNLKKSKLRSPLRELYNKVSTELASTKSTFCKLYKDKVSNKISDEHYQIIFEEINKDLHDLQQRKTEIERKLDEIKVVTKDIDLLIDLLIDIKPCYNNFDRYVLEKLVDKITVENPIKCMDIYQQHIHIYFKYIGELEAITIDIKNS